MGLEEAGNAESGKALAVNVELRDRPDEAEHLVRLPRAALAIMRSCTLSSSVRSPTSRPSRKAMACRQLALLRRLYGDGNWRNLKGSALVRLRDSTIALAEVHWYEAHGIGRKRMKVKRTV